MSVTLDLLKKWTVFAALSLLVVASPARASHFLGFSAGGYDIHMDVVIRERGSPDDWYSWIGSVYAWPPGSSRRANITQGVTVHAYEWEREIVLEYDGSEPAVPPFKLLVRGNRGTLHVSDKTIHAEFAWLM